MSATTEMFKTNHEFIPKLTHDNYPICRKMVRHHHSAWEETERWRVYGDTGMMEMDWAPEAYGDTGMTEMDWATGSYGDTGVVQKDWVTGSLYSGDSGVDRLYLISSSYTTKLHTLSFLSFGPARAFRDL